MAKQCPNCRSIAELAEPTCNSCGFKYFSPAKPSTNLEALCLRIGGAVFAIACVAVVIMKYA